MALQELVQDRRQVGHDAGGIQESKGRGRIEFGRARFADVAAAAIATSVGVFVLLSMRLYRTYSLPASLTGRARSLASATWHFCSDFIFGPPSLDTSPHFPSPLLSLLSLLFSLSSSLSPLLSLLSSLSSLLLAHPSPLPPLRPSARPSPSDVRLLSTPCVGAVCAAAVQAAATAALVSCAGPSQRVESTSWVANPMASPGNNANRGGERWRDAGLVAIAVAADVAAHSRFRCP